MKITLCLLTDDYVEGTKRLYSFFQVQSFIDNVRRAELTMSTHRSPFEILYNFGHMIESGVNIFRLWYSICVINLELNWILQLFWQSDVNRNVIVMLITSASFVHGKHYIFDNERFQGCEIHHSILITFTFFNFPCKKNGDL